jgi:Tfp pilus assembly protein PilF
METKVILIEKGKEALAKGDLAAAEKFFREALAKYPDSIDASLWLSRLLASTGHLAQAESLADQVLKTQSSHATALMVKGICRMKANDLEHALAFLEKAVEFEPDLALAHLNLAFAYRLSGKMDRAEASLKTLIRLDPKDPDAHYLFANTLLQQEKLEEASAKLEELLALHPAFTAAYLDLGLILCRSERSDLAEKLYRIALQRVSDPLAIRRRLILLYTLQERIEEARDERVVVASQTQDVNEWMQVGNLSVLAKDLPRAQDAFQKAVQLAPENWEPHCNLGDIYNAAGLTEEAGKEYGLALVYNRDRFEPHNAKGLWLLQQNRLPESAEQLRKANKISGGLPITAYNLSLALIQMKKKNEVKKLLKGIKLNPNAGHLAVEAARLLKALNSVSA